MASVDSPPPNTTQAVSWMVLYYILCVFALILMLIRFYGRWRFYKDWGFDDCFAFIGWLCLFVGLVLLQVETGMGLGRHIIYLPSEEVAFEILKLNTMFQVVNVLCTLFTKISISFFILRIRDTRRIRWVLGVMMTLMSLATLQVIIIIGVACTPTRKLWTPTLPGTCISPNSIMASSFVQSGFTIVTDACLTLSPIFILWNVQIPVMRKVSICGLMSLGLIATLSNALRNVYVINTHNPDFTYSLTPITILAVIELSSGMIAANVPACMPVFRHVRHKSKTTSPYDSQRSLRRSEQTRNTASSSIISPMEKEPTQVTEFNTV